MARGPAVLSAVEARTGARVVARDGLPELSPVAALAVRPRPWDRLRGIRRPPYNGHLFAPNSGVAQGKGKVGARKGSSSRRRAFWLLARHERGRVEVLTAELAGGGKALPVFSFAEEAELFLNLGAPVCAGGVVGGGWRAWRTETGELASFLLGPCRGVARVALDPMPEVGAGPVNRLTSVGRERFVRFLLEGEAGRAPAGPGPGRRRRGSSRPTGGGAHTDPGSEYCWNQKTR